MMEAIDAPIKPYWGMRIQFNNTLVIAAMAGEINVILGAPWDAR